MALRDHMTMGSDVFDDKTWKILGSGGFGRVYKALHKKFLFDVAIKLLNVDVRCSPSSLLPKEGELSNEVNNMDQASCEYVLRVYGLFKGIPPFGDNHRMETRGIVMEYMPKGSLETLPEILGGPPPEPLAFRLAYEVALGINFLHQRRLVHQDLKPSNVLLTKNLEAKLADFGLSIVSATATNSNRQTTGDVGGTYKYMPPEALLDISYEPRRDFDIYSYGIFLWSLFTGKEPYPGARRDLVELNVGKQGQRPPCNELNQRNVKGLKDLVDLMNKCWAPEPSERPKSDVCVGDTKRLFSMHEDQIDDAVSYVLAKLKADSDESVPPPGQSQSYDTVDAIEPARFSTQLLDSGSTDTMSTVDKAKFVKDYMPEIIQETMKVMEIVNELKKKEMVPSQIYTTITVKPEREEKVRTLYLTALRSGNTVKAAFYDALKKHQPELVEKLGRSQNRM